MAETGTRNFMRRKIGHIHFIGIGGIGMSGIAEVLLNLGYRVSGSDLQCTDTTERLRLLGVRLYYGHAAANLGNAQAVVTSTAIPSGNPEVDEARRRGIPVIPRAEMLAELLRMKESVAVSGCHGKTTTTSMISSILSFGGLDPTMVIGGKLLSIGTNARLGSGDIIVAEADESDGSFLGLAPLIAVITNIDREHLDYYRDIDEIKDAFVQFANSVPFYGATILGVDCGHVRDILPRIKRRVITYGVSEEADYRACDISFHRMSSHYTLSSDGETHKRIQLMVPGLFNVSNSLAAIAAARELDMTLPDIMKGIESYTGVQRRLEIKGSREGILVVDDYGHHPTEIRETLKAARQVWGGRITVVFQPHRYSRTRALFEEFIGAFNDADRVILTDIYGAREAAIPGVHASLLSEAIEKGGHGDVRYIAGFDDIVSFLRSETSAPDTIITLGAGNVWKVGEAFLEAGDDAKGPER
ncbi:MAG: UDP-N-acetylmuramate--L-alanine ligase [Syntrophales bacterium]|jgi:UDP-N-acetylmuramate--alanine ligase|nr:UDP-N-acetylmuramate--L-alanine ligase [Syntrophales bacterium]MCK9528619.1 UDP-N-acetylmuramate--L-alanine ligase [Syntrophales bacterium]MDX9923060.1 UDP-N-acetylmuramate--L-alanine ligase [Syntrophales bacterium]